MARVKYSPIVNDISGSVGSATFQKSRGISILRNKPVQGARSSEYSIRVKNATRQALNGWRALSSDERTQWNNFLTYSPQYQKNNKKLVLSGYALFIKYNTLRLLNNLSLLETFDYSLSVAPDLESLIVYDLGNLYFAFNEAFDDTNLFVQLRMSRSLPVKNSKQLNYLRIIDHSIVSSAFLNITSAYSSIYGGIPADNSYIKAEFRFIHRFMPYVFAPYSSIYQVEYL